MLAQTLQQSALTGNLHVVEAVAQLGATLAEGEILQLSHAEGEEISETTYYRIIRRKTAALFEACGTLAALSMGGDAAYLERVRRFGDRVGMCFQIRDDIFDYYDDERVGKPRGNDMREGKLTLPLPTSSSLPSSTVALTTPTGVWKNCAQNASTSLPTSAIPECAPPSSNMSIS